jgi:hypothetical protein
MTRQVLSAIIVLSCFLNGVKAQDKGLPITPVYQWTNSLEMTYFFIEKPVFKSIYKPTMFLRVGPALNGMYQYFPIDSLETLINPQGEAAQALNKRRWPLLIVGYIFAGTAIACAVTGNWQSNDEAIGWYTAAGVSLAAFSICLPLSRISKNGPLRIIEIHNKSIGYENQP